MFFLFISDIEVEGLFRKAGSNARQMLLKEMLNKSSDLNLDEGQFSPHDCASVLKGFLKELPECLMVDKFAKAHCQLCGKTFSKFFIQLRTIWFIQFPFTMKFHNHFPKRKNLSS